MRVGIDYRPALVNREGIGRYTRELVRGLIELSFDADLGLFGYTLKKSRFNREELGLAGSRAELLRLRLPSRWMPGLMRRLGKGADDLVGGAAVFHHTQYRRLPVREAVEVATIHDCFYMAQADYLDEQAAQGMTERARALAQSARRILVPSEYVGAEVVMKLGVFPNRVTVTGLGCDHFVRALPPEPVPKAKDPTIITVARVDNRKNHLRMLKAFEGLVAEGLPHRWIVAGPAGHGAEHFARALENSPAKERVRWRKFVPEQELPRLVAEADLCLFASLAEGFGLPPLEAMAAGTAVVTSCVTAMPEVCGDAALFVEPTDTERIFEGARRILTERELREDLISRGRRRARGFTWRETARHSLIAYQMATRPESEDGPPVRRSL